MSADEMLNRVAAGLGPFGLVPRGCFVFDQQTQAPTMIGHVASKSVIMVGHFGSAIWPHFVEWRRTHSNVTDPLDTWSKEVLFNVASQVGAIAVFPSDQPYQPFQQWAKRAEGLTASPLGLLIHPQYGLWHAFRGALLFDYEIEMPQPSSLTHPCDICLEKPCLSACPVNAFSENSFEVGRCRDYLSSQGFECMDNGCKARLACPVGQEHAYLQDQQRFHMSAFA
ncbi:hypothetical protein [Phyllobacterium sp. YR531]|uniref:hypothetical protein n=1 Tax=Phyllobacterium sp. YR531 TaxID=1144343 RepID=UPI00026F7E30|nr:hypothetical protein [Phyllobacterium sp. YR531]EJN03972.1 hypothetical protein PMI41_01607 [Phyllobacterium sp. YR531]